MLRNLQYSLNSNVPLRLQFVYKLVSNSLLATLICFSISIQALAATNVQYTYDNLNRLTKVVYGNGLIQQYGYDEAGNRVSVSTTVTFQPALTLNPVTTPTNSVSQNLSGTTDAGATVTVTVNGGAAKPATVTGTNWVFTVTDLITGINNILVTASYTGGGNTGISTIINSNAQQLTVSVYGTGGGTVTSTPTGISALSGSSHAFFDLDSSVTLFPTPNINSLFIDWSGNCLGSGACNVLMDTPKSVNATFNFIQPVRIPGSPPKDFSSIGEAYSTMSGNGTIQTRAYEFTGDLLLDKIISLTIDGGYDTTFQNYVGFAIQNGTLKIQNGSLTARRLVIK